MVKLPPAPLPILLFAWLLLALPGCTSTTSNERPNVILIMTDDQGYGDLGATGNPVIRTPHLDEMAQRSAQMTTFYVSPVCAPTRASLMTGRYNYRTRVVDTFIGRAMMEPEETTIAEILRGAGYRTGIFGKWHLGDTYPMRPMDQGFEEAIVHRGGGIGQPSDPTGAEGKYTDAVLIHNGEPVQTKGYCTDIYFDHALSWIEARHQQHEPFFAYISTNAPHGPFNDVPEDILQQYKQMDISDEQFPETEGHPIQPGANLDVRARIFSMITNIDDNVGRLFERLDALGLTENTIVVFMVDNGPDGRRYVAGMKGLKSHVHEGGVRSPFFMHWPAHLQAGHASDRVTAHIDVLPTLLDALDVPIPQGLEIDGRSFLPLLTGASTDWPDRYLTIQTHRGDEPRRYHHFMTRNQRWKLVHPTGFGGDSYEGDPAFELYDMQADPLEMNDLAGEHPDVVTELRTAYDTWFDDVSSTRPDNYAKPLIHVGTPFESPTVLTWQDWVHTEGRPWAPNSNGYWGLQVATAGTYDFPLRFAATETAGRVVLQLNDANYPAEIPAGSTSYTFENITLAAGPTRLQATLHLPNESRGARQVDVVKR